MSWTAVPWWHNCRTGAGRWDSPKSASPPSTCTTPSPVCRPGWRPASTAAWTTWRATASSAPGPPSWCRARSASSARAWTTCRAPRPRAGRPSNGRACAGPERAQVSLYARGRDYHKVLRVRLQQLADRLAEAIGPFGQRCFTDSAPVLEVELAKRASLGWRGKHTLLLSREAGSMFFLGEIYVSLALPPSPPLSSHCGQCSACIEVCPTQAIVAPYRLDARRCISYLTIEHEGEIPAELRAPSATACTAATTASSPAPGTSTRRAARCPTSTPARASAAPSCSACGAGARPSSCAAPRARRSAASATCAGAATWRW
jgi:ferredoxin